MLKKLALENILFLDIETVPEQEHFKAVNDEKQVLWEQKSKYQRKDEITAEEFYERAGIWAEFGKIICISVGYFTFGIELPYKLNLFGKKPWEIPHLDTMELWKFGDYKHYTSLKLMAHVLGIPSPKEDMDGSMVREVYYVEKDLERIRTYCELDVVTTAQVFLRLRNEELLAASEIIKA